MPSRQSWLRVGDAGLTGMALSGRTSYENVNMTQGGSAPLGGWADGDTTENV